MSSTTENTAVNITENIETLISELSHYASVIPGQEGLITGVPDSSKTAWRHVPVGEGGPHSDTELHSDVEQVLQGGDSDCDSAGDSDTDPLQSAGVWSDIETVKMHLTHLNRLKNSYMGEFDQLRHLLRESRRQYVKDVAVEKETLNSIHGQSKDTTEERAAYRRLKAMRRYHRHNGRGATARHALLDKRAAAVDGGASKERKVPSKQCCTYSQGSWKCGERSVPMAKHCVKHILEDPEQVLYQACGASAGGSEPCLTAIIPLPHVSTCIYHTPLQGCEATASERNSNNSPPVMELSDTASVTIVQTMCS